MILSPFFMLTWGGVRFPWEESNLLKIYVVFLLSFVEKSVGKTLKNHHN